MTREAYVRDAMQQVVGEVDDQSVYICLGDVVLAHLPPDTRWTTVEQPEGMGLATLMWSDTSNRWLPGPSYRPGEWTYCGRGMPGGVPATGPALSRHGARQEDVDRYMQRRGLR